MITISKTVVIAGTKIMVECFLPREPYIALVFRYFCGLIQ